MIVRRLEDVPADKVEMEGVRGAVKQLVLGEADGVPAYSVRVFTLEPGGHTPRHRHTSEHLNYVIAGEGVLVNEADAPIPLSPGDFALVQPDEVHQFRNAGDEPFVFICAVPKEYE